MSLYYQGGITFCLTRTAPAVKDAERPLLRGCLSTDLPRPSPTSHGPGTVAMGDRPLLITRGLIGAGDVTDHPDVLSTHGNA